MKIENFLKQYDYDLPDELIAKKPAVPRDSSRLFVFDRKTGEIDLDEFKNIADHLPKGALIVMNDTKVLPARITGKKETGGKVELLFLVNEINLGDAYVKVLADRKIVVGQKIFITRSEFFKVKKQEENIFYLKPLFPMRKLPQILFRHGRTPLPKYIGKSGFSEKILREKYQSVFARRPASAAAPTASLHFTPRLMAKLEKLGFKTAFVTLHVGLGTFSPLTAKNFADGKLHTEYYAISRRTADLLLRAKKEGRPVITVGTTTLRAIESAWKLILGERVRPIRSKTEMFIRKPYKFKVADGLVTNFHLPKSSLMCLVDAFLDCNKSSKNIVDLYRLAVKNKFRFYSFGDAMLIV